MNRTLLILKRHSKTKNSSIYANFYEIHKAIGSWDSLHCEDAPLVEFSYEFIKREFKEKVANYVGEGKENEVNNELNNEGGKSSG